MLIEKEIDYEKLLDCDSYEYIEGILNLISQKEKKLCKKRNRAV